GAIQRYQAECCDAPGRGKKFQWIGSPGSWVAFTVEPDTLPSGPTMTVALVKWSFTGCAAARGARPQLNPATRATAAIDRHHLKHARLAAPLLSTILIIFKCKFSGFAVLVSVRF